MLSPCLQVVQLLPEVELDRPLETDDELLRVSMRVRLLSRRAANIQLGDEHLEVLERSWSEQELPTELAERERWTAFAPENPWTRASSVRLE